MGGQLWHHPSGVKGVLPRGMIQIAKGPDDTRGYGVGSGDLGKELPRGLPVDLCPFRVDIPVTCLENWFQDVDLRRYLWVYHGCPHAVKVPTTLGSTEWGRDVWAGAPRNAIGGPVDLCP